MSNINDVRPLCEIIKGKQEPVPTMVLFKKVTNEEGKTILNTCDNLLEATKAIFQNLDGTQELISEEKQ